MEELVGKLIEILAPLLLAGLGYLGKKLVDFINAKEGNEYLRGALVRLEEAVETAVREVAQTVVDGLKAASADGTLSKEDIRDVKAKALAAVKAYLGARGLAELAKVLGLQGGAIDKLLSGKIEAAVHKLRAEAPLALQAGPIDGKAGDAIRAALAADAAPKEGAAARPLASPA